MDKITLAHGSGGKPMHRLIDSLFLKEFSNAIGREKKDSAILSMKGATLAFTTDSYVVDPLFFPGGDIGCLAVNGTVNDLSVCGARPFFLSCAMVIEEGLDIVTLERVVRSMKLCAQACGVRIVTGDTKVVETGKCDKLFITTSGIGVIDKGITLSIDNIKPSDAVIINGPIGDHAISILSVREGIGFGSKVKSDSAPLGSLVFANLRVSKKIRFMRDPTRGGMAATLNEIVQGRNFGIALDEEKILVSPGTRSACELLGLDPLFLANEGKVIVIVASQDAIKVVREMRRHPLGRQSEIIGRVETGYKGKVYLNTSIGGKRIVDMPSGDQLPRIC